MLVRKLEVSTEGGPVTVNIGSVAVVLRRVGERIVSVAIDADRSVPISVTPENRRPSVRD